MLLHGANKKLWVDVSGASFGWSKLEESSQAMRDVSRVEVFGGSEFGVKNM
jgi:hypothetical protein